MRSRCTPGPARPCDEELGLEPSVTLRSLQERVLRQDESLGAQAEPAVPVRAPAAAQRRTGQAAPDGTPGHRGVPSPRCPRTCPPWCGRSSGATSSSRRCGRSLPGVRLLSLVGPGGAGKTSLALTLAVRARPDFPDGVFGVRLASLDTARQVPVAVADALGMPMDGAAAESDIRERLFNYLANRRLLLLLDNCEHVVDAAAGLADDILGRCPDVTILATSREALAVPDEVQVNVGPLAAPPKMRPRIRSSPTRPSSCSWNGPARLDRGPSSTSPTSLAIGRVTRALDGMPLAVELAAARASTMSPVEISDRLDHRFALLTSGSRTAEARQQTLRATVDWSYALLSSDEQRLFDRLSVFQGGWTMDAAEAVLDDPGAPEGFVLDAVARLVERSMVIVDPGSPTRYRMLETLRQYAAERLLDSGEPPRSRPGMPATSTMSWSPQSSTCEGLGNGTPCSCCDGSSPTFGPL